MAASSDIASQWKALSLSQRNVALSHMSAEQKQKLAWTLGFKAAPPAAALAPRASITPEARTAGNYATETIRGVGRGLKDDVVGPFQMLRHPIDTASGLYKQEVDATKKASAENRALKNKGVPLLQRAAATTLTGLENAPMIGGMIQHAEQGGPRMASPEAVGAAAEAATSFAAPELAGKAIALAPRAARAVSGAGPNVVRGLVKDTQDANAAAADKAAVNTAKARAAVDAANAKLAADRSGEVRSHFEKTQAAKAAAERKEGVLSRKAALESGLRKLSDKFQEDLKATRDKAAEEADAKYRTLDDALGETQADGEFLPNALMDASEKIKGSDTEPTIFRDIEKKIERGDTMNYSDLQGYYSELGRELKRGKLAGDVYTAYNNLQDSIGDEMQRIADAQGMGPQLTDARTSWRNLKQTFYDPKSPLKKALDSKEPGVAVRVLVGKDRTAIEAMAKYDPNLAQRANVLRGYQEEAGTRTPATAPAKPVSQLAPRKAPAPYAEPETAVPKKLDSIDVRKAKADAIFAKANKIKASSGHLANTFVMLDAIRNAMRGDMHGIAVDVGARVAYGAGKQATAALLSRPAVVDFLSKATPRDVAAIPAYLRGDFPEIVRRAQARGIRISPALKLSFAGAGLIKSGNRQNPTDAWAGVQQ